MKINKTFTTKHMTIRLTSEVSVGLYYRVDELIKNSPYTVAITNQKYTRREIGKTRDYLEAIGLFKKTVLEYL